MQELALAGSQTAAADSDAVVLSMAFCGCSTGAAADAGSGEPASASSRGASSGDDSSTGDRHEALVSRQQEEQQVCRVLGRPLGLLVGTSQGLLLVDARTYAPGFFAATDATSACSFGPPSGSGRISCCTAREGRPGAHVLQLEVMPQPEPGPATAHGSGGGDCTPGPRTVYQRGALPDASPLKVRPTGACMLAQPLRRLHHAARGMLVASRVPKPADRCKDCSGEAFSVRGEECPAAPACRPAGCRMPVGIASAGIAGGSGCRRRRQHQRRQEHSRQQQGHQRQQPWQWQPAGQPRRQEASDIQPHHQELWLWLRPPHRQAGPRQASTRQGKHRCSLPRSCTAPARQACALWQGGTLRAPQRTSDAYRKYAPCRWAWRPAGHACQPAAPSASTPPPARRPCTTSWRMPCHSMHPSTQALSCGSASQVTRGMG